MYKIDLHTHSQASPDGGITANQYAHALSTGLLDVIAITDHNTIDYALQVQAQLGDKIIVGEEIMTTQGEIIGLYLKELVPAGLSVQETCRRIKAQGGIVYIPHPFETVRSGIHPQALEEITKLVDIIEVCNGRAFLQNRGKQAVVWAKFNHVPGAASSDAHGVAGLGKTYTRCQELPTKSTLVAQISTGTPMTDRPSLRALLYPKYHRTRKKLRRQS
jgi:predicted metal-dependent phosphoesterase TrpH